MIQTIAVDDELPALQLLENFCDRAEFIHLQKSFNKPGEALQYIAGHPVDLLFLDINMPSLSGIELYKKISRKTMVIFTTAYSQYAVEGFELNAIDYLMKPFSFDRFMQAVSKAKEWHNYESGKKSEEENSILVRADYSIIKIYFADIIYLEGLGDYIKIHLQNQRPVITRITMKNIAAILPKKQFIRIHRSYIVSLFHVTRISYKSVVVNGTKLPVSSSYEEELTANFTNKNMP